MVPQMMLAANPRYSLTGRPLNAFKDQKLTPQVGDGSPFTLEALVEIFRKLSGVERFLSTRLIRLINKMDLCTRAFRTLRSFQHLRVRGTQSNRERQADGTQQGIRYRSVRHDSHVTPIA